ncbi:PREDICTED: uncharacterized protein LOC108502346 [Lepidothrix coronata]|uniref:Uncharacterized protein LOC108502346 n=1 Tax=Lepidothrix coronata TaxID=321398 RepID=A0A6J0I4B1_9PASS|nr:PREDICTED: uncharacterized protein LOC108502346 [Lepidothrix coronata]
MDSMLTVIVQNTPPSRMGKELQNKLQATEEVLLAATELLKWRQLKDLMQTQQTWRIGVATRHLEDQSTEKLDEICSAWSHSLSLGTRWAGRGPGCCTGTAMASCFPVDISAFQFFACEGVERPEEGRQSPGWKKAAATKRCLKYVREINNPNEIKDRVFVGSDEIDKRGTRAIKKDFKALGQLVDGTAAQVVFASVPAVAGMNE